MVVADLAMLDDKYSIICSNLKKTNKQKKLVRAQSNIKNKFIDIINWQILNSTKSTFQLYWLQKSLFAIGKKPRHPTN